MIQRYPHTGLIEIETLSDGPLPTKTTEEIEVRGRYEPNTRPGGGGGIQYSAKFYCEKLDILKQDPHYLDGKKLKIFGRSIDIVKGWPYQIHTELWLD